MSYRKQDMNPFAHTGLARETNSDDSTLTRRIVLVEGQIEWLGAVVEGIYEAAANAGIPLPPPPQKPGLYVQLDEQFHTRALDLAVPPMLKPTRCGLFSWVKWGCCEITKTKIPGGGGGGGTLTCLSGPDCGSTYGKATCNCW